MQNVLIISGHSNLERSNANRKILNLLSTKLTDAKVRYLSELYPDFKIDVKAEQEHLQNADTIILQFPIYWYSVPALLKKWIEDVLTADFAYGANAKLQGKKIILSCTCGASKADFSVEGKQKNTIENYLFALRQTFVHCGLNVTDLICGYSMDPSKVSEPAYQNDIEEQVQKILQAVEA